MILPKMQDKIEKKKSIETLGMKYATLWVEDDG